jgi:putative ABC transport system permease protein
MLRDYFSLAFGNLIHRKLRSWLTMIGIFIGIAAVVALISVGQGLQRAINEQFALIGADKLIVAPKGSGFGPPGAATAGALTEHDLELVERVSGVEAVAGRLFGSAQIEFNDRIHTHFVISIPDEQEGLELIEEIELLKIEDGRFLKTDDKGKVIVGARYAEDTDFGKAVRVGNTVLIKDQPFKVVGVLRKSGDPGLDSGILVPEEDLRALFGNEKGFNNLFVKVRSGADVLQVSADITKAMRRDRGLREGKEDFDIETPEQLLESFNTVLNVVQVVLVGIAAISLLVGGIGIMNTMYTSVLERTKEIGIMKAVGAQKKDILLIMLIESGLLGLMGGLVGVLVGIGLGKGVEYAAFQAFGTSLIQAHVSVELIFGALLFSFVIGTVSGLLPAKKAAELVPVEALRYE